MVGIYKIESPSGKIYIGQSWNIEFRFNQYKQLKCKRQLSLYNSLIKYGFDNHVINVIHELPADISQEVIDIYEIIYWKQYKDLNHNMLNIRQPGSRGKHSEETKKKMSESSKGKNTWTKGRKLSEAQKIKLSEDRKGKPKSEEHKQKIRDAKRITSEETRQKMRDAWEKRIVSDETKKKISQALKGNTYALGKKHSEDTKKKIKDSLKKRYSNNQKPGTGV